MLVLSGKIRLIVALALTLLIIALPRPGLAQGGGGRVYLSPATIAVKPGEQLTVEIAAAGMTNLYAAEVHLRFDPQVLAVLDADPKQEGVQLEAGSFLDPQHGFVVANKADNGEGTALFAITLVNPAPPVQGDGVLARVSFKALQSGTADIQLEKALMVNNSVKLIEISTEGAQAQIGGQVSPGQASATPLTAPAPAATAPASTSLANLFGPLLLAVVIVGLIVAGVFLRPYLRPPARQPGSRDARQRDLQPRQPAVTGQQPEKTAMLLQQAGVALAKGDRTAAYYRYSQAAEMAPDSEQAWLGKAQTTRSPTEKRLCLMRVLTINPGNREAQVELQSLDKAKMRV